MKIFNLLKTVVLICFAVGFALLIVLFPDISRSGVTRGILLCGRVIIPSLFPFTMCVLFVMNIGISNSSNRLSNITKRIFCLNFFEFSCVFLSLIGGYPIGAKLINEAVAQKKITTKKAESMLFYCINAGPAFIISAVGCSVFNSKNIGRVLFASHILSSLCICMLTRKKEYIDNPQKSSNLPLSDNFVLSAANTSKTLISISSFVILFSAINSYFLHFGESVPIFKNIALLLEITNSLTYCRNIYIISFLLGFGGICIWFQVFAAVDNFKINYFKFALFRLLHGILSTLFTYVIIKTFKITVPTISNITFKPIYSTPAVTVSLIIMVLIFTISLETKKYSSQIIDIT